jgi:hypothetical protein
LRQAQGNLTARAKGTTIKQGNYQATPCAYRNYIFSALIVGHHVMTRQHPRAGPARANTIRLNEEQKASQGTQNATKYVYISFAFVPASFAYSNFGCPHPERLLLGQDPLRGLLGVGSACRIDRRQVYSVQAGPVSFATMQWVESAVRDLEVSYPEDGIFDVDCAELKKIHLDKIYKMDNMFVFCVEVNRVGDFIEGERERGLCRLLTVYDVAPEILQGSESAGSRGVL